MPTQSNDQPETNRANRIKSKVILDRHRNTMRESPTQYNQTTPKGVTHMENKTKNAIINLVQDIAVMNRIMVRDEKKMTDKRWQELREQESNAMKTIIDLLEKETTV